MHRHRAVLFILTTLTLQAADYFVDPVNGNDANAGTRANSAWKSLAGVNKLQLGPGDKVSIAPGVLDETLQPQAAGTEEKPVIIYFSSGRHEFRAGRAARVRYFVSNSADAPEKPRPVGILVRNARHLRITGARDSEVWFGGRMTYLINDQSEDVVYSGLTFDMVRPTVSEFRVVETGTNSAVIQVAEGSTYSIGKGRFVWTGDLGTGWTMVQAAVPETGKCRRLGKWDPFAAAQAEDLGKGRVRLTYKSRMPEMAAGQQFQFRNVDRDNTSAFNTRSKDIAFRDCNFYALPGMGIVSQFTENIAFERVNVVPRPGTLRTCPAWADCFHFSGCRGQVLVDSCRFSGTQDDPVNVHGTHLRLVEKLDGDRVLVRFMHPQTYGFAAFQPGDRVEFVSHLDLRAYAAAVVQAIKRRTDRDWVLALDAPVPGFSPGDVIDNVSWYPDLTIRRCRVTMDSCRGFLITTRGKVLVEDNTFHRTAMSAIDISDDANSWFESGPVRDVTIRGNRFVECGAPVIRIMPEIRIPNPAEPVHRNIRILDNSFDLAAGTSIQARSVQGLTITGNRFSTASLSLDQQACTGIVIEGNRFSQTEP